MNYILIYDILKHIDLNPFTIFLNMGIYLCFPFLISLAIIKKKSNKKIVVKIYLLMVIFFTTINWIKAKSIKRIITEHKYLEVKGEINNYT